MKTFLSKGWPLAALALAGCGSQATPDYPGEKLSVVKGVVVSELTQAEPEDALVVAEWGQVGAMFGFDRTVAEIEGEFPAQFSLTLYEPPPEQVLYNPAEQVAWSGVYPFDPEAEPMIALAHIVALGRDAEGKPDPYNVLGASEQHALLYAADAIEEGSLAAEMFHATLPAGYHLVQIAEQDHEAERAVVECNAAAETIEEWKVCGISSRLDIAAPSTQVTVRLAPEADLEFPSYSPVYLPPGTDLTPPHGCVMGDPMIPCE